MRPPDDDQSQEITIPQHNTPVIPQITTQANTALKHARVMINHAR